MFDSSHVILGKKNVSFLFLMVFVFFLYIFPLFFIPLKANLLIRIKK